jgi:nucleotide-binding universal stress UspA family protein
MNAASLMARWSRYPDASLSATDGPHGDERMPVLLDGSRATEVIIPFVLHKENAMYKRVLVPVDGSGVAESILPFILEIASPPELDVILLHVNGIIPPMAIEGTRSFAADDFEARREEAEMYLGLLGADLRNSGVRVHTRVRRGEPVDEILAAARNEGADLIAMTTHGRTGPARLLCGSVAEGVVRHAPIPVFLVRRTEKEVARRRRDVAAARRTRLFEGRRSSHGDGSRLTSVARKENLE